MWRREHPEACCGAGIRMRRGWVSRRTGPRGQVAVTTSIGRGQSVGSIWGGGPTCPQPFLLVGGGGTRTKSHHSPARVPQQVQPLLAGPGKPPSGKAVWKGLGRVNPTLPPTEFPGFCSTMGTSHAWGVPFAKTRWRKVGGGALGEHTSEHLAASAGGGVHCATGGID